MARLGTPLREQNSCQCEACFTIWTWRLAKRRGKAHTQCYFSYTDLTAIRSSLRYLLPYANAKKKTKVRCTLRYHRWSVILANNMHRVHIVQKGATDFLPQLLQILTDFHNLSCTTSPENAKVIGVRISCHTFVMLLPYLVKVSNTKVSHFKRY